ncbi:cytochrome-c oxidase [Brevibacillus sp. H7]|uniref:cytochrome-c oxidase n=1 Tax=Brevibacillus sp. H7 TaxID=3349138 RepID=UPI0037FD2A94
MAARCLKIAVVYFVIAVLMGISMGILQFFAVSSVHAHLNLLGWVSLALVGLIYRAYPKAGETRLASVHFWLHNIGLPLMQGSLFIMMTTGNHGLVIGAIIGSILIGVGVILFAVNVCQQVRDS